MSQNIFALSELLTAAFNDLDLSETTAAKPPKTAKPKAAKAYTPDVSKVNTRRAPKVKAPAKPKAKKASAAKKIAEPAAPAKPSNPGREKLIAAARAHAAKQLKQSPASAPAPVTPAAPTKAPAKLAGVSKYNAAKNAEKPKAEPSKAVVPAVHVHVHNHPPAAKKPVTHGLAALQTNKSAKADTYRADPNKKHAHTGTPTAKQDRNSKQADSDAENHANSKKDDGRHSRLALAAEISKSTHFRKARRAAEKSVADHSTSKALKSDSPHSDMNNKAARRLALDKVKHPVVSKILPADGKVMAASSRAMAGAKKLGGHIKDAGRNIVANAKRHGRNANDSMNASDKAAKAAKHARADQSAQDRMVGGKSATDKHIAKSAKADQSAQDKSVRKSRMQGLKDKASSTVKKYGDRLSAYNARLNAKDAAKASHARLDKDQKHAATQHKTPTFATATKQDKANDKADQARKAKDQAHAAKQHKTPTFATATKTDKIKDAASRAKDTVAKGFKGAKDAAGAGIHKHLSALTAKLSDTVARVKELHRAHTDKKAAASAEKEKAHAAEKAAKEAAHHKANVDRAHKAIDTVYQAPSAHKSPEKLASKAPEVKQPSAAEKMAANSAAKEKAHPAPSVLRRVSQGAIDAMATRAHHIKHGLHSILFPGSDAHSRMKLPDDQGKRDHIKGAAAKLVAAHGINKKKTA